MLKISYFLTFLPLLHQTLGKSVNKRRDFDGVLTEDTLFDFGYTSSAFRIELIAEGIKSIEDNAFVAFSNLEYLV